MLSMQVTAQVWWFAVRDRARAGWQSDDGMTTETVIITAILAALALAVGAIIVAKVTTKANNIPTGGAADQ
jgi:hypothetical protein